MGLGTVSVKQTNVNRINTTIISTYMQARPCLLLEGKIKQVSWNPHERLQILVCNTETAESDRAS